MENQIFPTFVIGILFILLFGRDFRVGMSEGKIVVIRKGFRVLKWKLVCKSIGKVCRKIMHRNRLFIRITNVILGQEQYILGHRQWQACPALFSPKHS